MNIANNTSYFICDMTSILKIIIIYVIGKNYDDLSSRQQRQRKLQIKQNSAQFLEEHLREIGLKPHSLSLETTNGSLLQLSLSDSPTVSSNTTACHSDRDVTKNLLYVLMKYGVSMECYHELSKEFPCLPKSYLVRCYTYRYK